MPLFDINKLEAFSPNIELTSVYKKTQRWIKSGKILQLRKGLYMSREYFEKNQFDENFRVFIANNLLFPSYVSGAYVLQRYEILTDITHPITSVTLKSSRKYTNKMGNFLYNSISEDLYTGYKAEFYGMERVHVASKAKALFDFLYFKYLKVKNMPDDLLGHERFDLSTFIKEDKKEFEKYCDLSRGTLFKNLSNILFI